MLNETELKQLINFAVDIRIETVQQMGNLGFGHLGGAMSIADLIAVLYGKVMKYNPDNPEWEGRDYLVLSKGHAGPALYSALALKRFFPKEDLVTLNTPGTKLPSHCDMTKTKGIDMTTGSLGQGASLAVGLALGHKLKNMSNYTYLILGDGECQEGQVWEAVMFAGHKKLDNLITFIDSNKMQIDGSVEEMCKLEDFCTKFKDFGWYAQRVDGHDCTAIYEAIEDAKKNPEGKPSVIVMDTIKAKGCSFALNIPNHHMVVPMEDAKQAVEELKKAYV